MSLQAGAIKKNAGKHGFILTDSGEDLFVLPKQCVGFEMRIPPLGTRVQFTLGQDPQKGAPLATNVEPEQTLTGSRPARGSRKSNMSSLHPSAVHGLISRGRQRSCSRSQKRRRRGSGSDFITNRCDESPVHEVLLQERPLGSARDCAATSSRRSDGRSSHYHVQVEGETNPVVAMRTFSGSSLNVEEYMEDTLCDGWLERATSTFREYGFCICANMLNKSSCEAILKVCRETEAEMLQYDPAGLGNRDPGRYSFGAAQKSKSMLHHDAWKCMLDNPSCIQLLQRVFEGRWEFVGGGGDFVRGGTKNYQALHSDLGAPRVPASLRGSHPPPKVGVNFSVQPITMENGPMRIVPGRKVLTGSSDMPPPFPLEPEEMRQSKLCPLPPGVAIVRDLRVWHAGTPNLSSATRFLPNVEAAAATFIAHQEQERTKKGKGGKGGKSCLPRGLFDTLSPKCRDLCARLVPPSGKGAPVTGVNPSLVQPQRTWEKGGKGMGRQ